MNYDKVRIGQVVLAGSSVLQERVIYRISEIDGVIHYDYLESGKPKSLVMLEIHSIISGPSAPETEDVSETMVAKCENPSIPTHRFSTGQEVIFKVEHEGAELDIEGYILVAGGNWCILSEKGVSVPNRNWRVHGSSIRPI